MINHTWVMWGPSTTQNVGTIGSAVLTFIWHRHPKKHNRQGNMYTIHTRRNRQNPDLIFCEKDRFLVNIISADMLFWREEGGEGGWFSEIIHLIRQVFEASTCSVVFFNKKIVCNFSFKVKNLFLKFVLISL